MLVLEAKPPFLGNSHIALLLRFRDVGKQGMVGTMFIGMQN
jgi:hypothetical protein